MSMITELVKRLRKHADEDYREAADVIEELSAKLQAANMERSSQYYNGGWIPVSERLPEDGQNVLFSTKTDRVFEGKYYADTSAHNWLSYKDDTYAWNNVVTAWMPLPEPYKASPTGAESEVQDADSD